MRFLRTILAICAVIAVAAFWQFAFGDESVAPQVQVPTPVATIGSGSEAVPVSADGSVIAWLPLPDDTDLPRLPLGEPPAGERIGGPVLEQVEVLAAAPAALQPYVEGSSYGESGVEVELNTGIELRFGSPAQAARKWKAAAAVLAEPSVTALDYVDLHAPGRPATGGSGHALPPIP